MDSATLTSDDPGRDVRQVAIADPGSRFAAARAHNRTAVRGGTSRPPTLRSAFGGATMLVGAGRLDEALVDALV